MKIAVWHNLPSGGGKRALYYQVKGLLTRGHSVEVWRTDAASDDFLPLSELTREHVLPLGLPPVPRFGPGIREAVRRYRDRMARICALDRHCQSCARQIEAGGFDLLLAGPSQFLHTPPIGRHCRLPRVLYLQEPSRFLYEAQCGAPWRSPSPDDWGWRSPRKLAAMVTNLVDVQGFRNMARAEYLFARGYDRILVNSCFSRESVLLALGVDAKVCPLGIDTDLFRPPDSGGGEGGYIIGLGAIVPRKAIERSIRAVGAIPKAVRPELVWVGDSVNKGHKAKLEREAKDRGVHISFHVGVSDQALVRLLGGAIVMLYTPYLEPFGFAPLEANACGVPVVAIAEGGVRESMKPGVNGFLVPDDNPQALANAIVRFLDDPEMRLRMGQTGREDVVRNWTWNRGVTALVKHLQEVVTAKGGDSAGR